jgi:hypothetical protein
MTPCKSETSCIPYRVWTHCGAKTRAGTPCKGKAMYNGRCRMHGGKSTGPYSLRRCGIYSKNVLVRIAACWRIADLDEEFERNTTFESRAVCEARVRGARRVWNVRRRLGGYPPIPKKIPFPPFPERGPGRPRLNGLGRAVPSRSLR